jgi:hypothetical protein
MRKLLITLIFALLLSIPGFSQEVDTTTLNQSDITNIITLDNTKIYLMRGFNIVRNGGAIVIPEGTLVKGDYNSKGTLIVERGGIIHANGTAQRPIVFTSRQAPGSRLPGDWGGIIILGRSGINTSTGADSAKIDFFPPGMNFYYGGQPIVDSDSSGCLRFIRIEYAGVNLQGPSGIELNGLTLAGVGSKTIVEHIQISYCGDDSFEWFGGTVNAKYLVSIGAVDDDFECDNGYRGHVQFGLAVRDSSYSDVSKSHFFEFDNNSNTPTNYNNPRTSPIISNFTCVGPNITNNPLYVRGILIRRNSTPRIYNSVMGAYGTLFKFDGEGVYNASLGDTLRIRNNAFSYLSRLADTASGFNPIQWLLTPAFMNSVHNPYSSLMLTDPFGFYELNGPDPIDSLNYWVPLPGSPVLSGSDFNHSDLSGFEVTTYRGAFGISTSNWLTGWTNFNPQWYYEINPNISLISNQVPERFSLSQNYLNPFNPSTKINFNVPAKGFVTLKVYDALGQEVAELVNQNLNVGEYAYDFNASILSSGIYFYTLRGENFVETKKMMLVK